MTRINELHENKKQDVISKRQEARDKVLFLLLFSCFLLIFVSCVPPRVALVKKTCVDCHQKEYKKYSSDESRHNPVIEKLCEGCHIPHGAIGALYLKNEGSALCYNCHEKDKERLEKKNLHDPLKKKDCLPCHSPHSSKSKKLLRIDGNELCFKCHNKENFMRKKIHKPQEEGCVKCHNPHSSDNPHGLIMPVRQLCLGCHEANSGLKAAHRDYPFADSDCTGCHASHSSSNEKLLRENIHKPFAELNCDSCHNPSDSKLPLGMKIEGDAL